MKLKNKKLKVHSTNSDSNTQVNFRLSDPRATCAFKGNKKLWKAFVRYCKANYGSVCHVLEPIQVALMSNQVNLSNTIKPLVIENMTVERAVKRVRRYSVEEETVALGLCHYCHRVSNGMYRFIRTGELFPLCSYHAAAMLEQGTWELPKSEGVAHEPNKETA
jgi:hypothetical protein